MEGRSKYDKILVRISNILLRYLMGVICFCLILATIGLTKTLIIDLFKSPILLLNANNLISDVFQSILIIVIGYELFKALHIVVNSRAIPDLPIVQIAIIALANKIIALDVLIDDYKIMLGLATILTALAISHYLLRSKKTQ
ncbi:Uncharacterized membrane protein, DUF373 family [Daejeonella rubra]|uniref:Uncharacterized membrane protein, DUF373 family n=1 Tax=Daejeonella rubra TaxID=990371 RepID=A0A1G9YPH6_9SPHI|nr:phosphate-starvation-inducible PsiE family protein [Daejeonella rubra]SDN10922.1 Uncharacterized membrane protein, DUF373 family [Daejeonella rubra]